MSETKRESIIPIEAIGILLLTAKTAYMNALQLAAFNTVDAWLKEIVTLQASVPISYNVGIYHDEQ